MFSLKTALNSEYKDNVYKFPIIFVKIQGKYK